MKEETFSYGTGYTDAKADSTDSYIWPHVFNNISLLRQKGIILDAGCGNGHFANELKSRGFNVIGIDSEKTGILAAQKKFPEIRFETASVYDNFINLNQELFDGIISLEVIEHLFDPELFLLNCKKSLKPDGKLILSTPYHGYLKNLLIALANKSDKHYSPSWKGGHIKFWSRTSLTEALENTGFKVDSFIGAGRCPLLWKSMVLICSHKH